MAKPPDNPDSGKSDPGEDSAPADRRWVLALAALGVVFGDIGTSPLYAFRECFSGALTLSEANILGILSLIIWSLIIVVSLKYLLYVMRADNRGEGGILALLTLVAPKIPESVRARRWLIMMGVFGAALLYGDGIITPAISVLSAVEGLEIAAPALDAWVIPLAIAILVGLFLIQRHGTSAVGAMFGPVTLVWFLCIAVLGMPAIAREPHVLLAFNPLHGARFFAANGLIGFLALGGVFLVVTGSEALYADMGHFGREPIRMAWFRLVFPALTINYLGQGALLLQRPAAIENPFFRMAPEWMLLPLVFLATAATVIASQAVISGAFSLTRQALQLGFLPRMQITHSSQHEIGQVYVPFVNWALLIATVGLVLGFRSSSALAGAYGVAVTTTMVLTTLLAYFCSRANWKWSLGLALAVTVPFLVVDLGFFGANLAKIPQGGWFPLLVAGIVSLLMTTWKRGRNLLKERLTTSRVSELAFLASMAQERIARVPGIAIFMDSNTSGIPRTLLHNIKHNRVLHERIVLLTMATDDVPRVPGAERLEVRELAPGFLRVVAHYGYMETPKMPEVLSLLETRELHDRARNPSVFLARETLIITDEPGMSKWRKYLYSLMERNAQRPTLHFGISPGHVVELGQQVEL